MQKTVKTKNGFTIIELVISIFILSIAVIGIFSAFSVMSILTSNASDQLTATYLAQEGMEIVRNIRDTNWLNMDAGIPVGATWLDGLSNCEVGSGGCQADYKATSLSPYGAGNYLYTNENGLYVYNPLNPSPIKTKFERKIVITPIQDGDGNSDHIIDVKVQVSWDGKANILYPIAHAGSCGLYNCITTESTLYDWYGH
jgi:type II secretory pathway pseudopilin PulG